MNTSFGPWSTAMGGVDRNGLSAFWKRRLGMLSVVSRGNRSMARRHLIVLTVAGVTLCGLPTFYGAPLAGVLAGDDKGGSAVGKSAEKAEAEYLPRPSDVEVKILAALEAPTSMTFAEKPLGETMQILAKQHGITIWVDTNALQEEGIDRTQAVTLQVQGVRLASALKLLLDPLNLMYVVEDDVLKITSKSKAGNTLLARTYPVRDLCTQAKDFEELVRAIEKTVEPSSWQGSGGQGTILAVQASGSLVVSQTHDLHAKVLQLLRTLREAKQKGAK